MCARLQKVFEQELPLRAGPEPFEVRAHDAAKHAKREYAQYTSMWQRLRLPCARVPQCVPPVGHRVSLGSWRLRRSRPCIKPGVLHHVLARRQHEPIVSHNPAEALKNLAESEYSSLVAQCWRRANARWTTADLCGGYSGSHGTC